MRLQKDFGLIVLKIGRLQKDVIDLCARGHKSGWFLILTDALRIFPFSCKSNEIYFFSRTYHSIFIHVQCALRRHHSVASSLGTIQILRKHYFGGFSNPPAVYVLFACKNDQFLNHTPSPVQCLRNMYIWMVPYQSEKFCKFLKFPHRRGFKSYYSIFIWEWEKKICYIAHGLLNRKDCPCIAPN